MKTHLTEGQSAHTRLLRPREAASEEGRSRLAVYVIFTTEPSTLGALKTACCLASGLQAKINLIAIQTVHWALPLTQPAVGIKWNERRLLDLAARGAGGSVETNVCIYLCRDKWKALLEALPPHALVVMGCRTIWWPGATKRIGRELERHGHRVIFARQR